MKKLIYFIVLIIASLFVNCSNNKNPNSDNRSEVKDKIVPQIINFPESGEDTLNASFFADTVIHIPLETTKESFIDYIDQIWMADSYILINCRQAGLLLFQQDGKFVSKIGKRGRGPGEYGIIFHFDVISDTIYISSSGRRGFLRYKFDGTFCDEIKFNYQPIYFSTTFDQKLACYVMEEGKIFVYNKNLYSPPDTIVVEYGVTKGRYIYSFITDKNMAYLQKTPTGLLFYDYMSDTIWNIANTKKEPTFIVNMKNKLPRDQGVEFGHKNWSQMVTSYQLVHLLPFPTFMFIYQKHWRGGGYDAIYIENTKTGVIKRFDRSWIYDDIVSLERLWVLEYVYSLDYLVAISFPPERDPKKIKDNVKPSPSPLWLDQMKTVTVEDNPILVKIRLKKNY